ncbi:MAG: crossover junction endodeoxyribonuclease RuvC [Patescibacteria group bacterium]
MTEIESKIILGIDPGTNIIGWGVVKKEGSKFIALKFGCVNVKSKTDPGDGLLLIYEAISDIIKNEKPSEMAIERLFFFRNQKTVMSVAEARGVVILSAKKNKIPVFEYTPLQIKQAVSGYGRADKKQIQEMIKLTFGLKESPKPDDVADALAVAVCHASTNQKIR